MGEEVRHTRFRSPRRGSTPTCSIVIVSHGDQEVLDSCIDRLAEPCARFAAEIVIVVPASSSDFARLKKRYKAARVVQAPVDYGDDDLRGFGLLEAGGDIVAITADHDVRGEEWLAVLERRARNNGVYGPTVNGATDWARHLEDLGAIPRNGNGA
ncbi:MAG TPA: hypothetical protein VMM77_01530 [Gemmatimonadaceae bacterium]|nr:hypothetical protein [Gemmatimonadaceae bacterium]